MRGVNTFSFSRAGVCRHEGFGATGCEARRKGRPVKGCAGPQAAVALAGRADALLACFPLSVTSTHPAGAVGQSWSRVEVLCSSVVLSPRTSATKRYAGWQAGLLGRAELGDRRGREWAIRVSQERGAHAHSESPS